MTTKLTQLRVGERRDTLWQIAVLDVLRLLVRSGADHLDAAATWASVAAEASRRAHQHGGYAIEEGNSYAEVARALGISRQAAAKRYRRLSVHLSAATSRAAAGVQPFSRARSSEPPA